MLTQFCGHDTNRTTSTSFLWWIMRTLDNIPGYADTTVSLFIHLYERPLHLPFFILTSFPRQRIHQLHELWTLESAFLYSISPKSSNLCTLYKNVAVQFSTSTFKYEFQSAANLNSKAVGVVTCQYLTCSSIMVQSFRWFVSRTAEPL